MSACAPCLRRARLLSELSPGIDRDFAGRRTAGVLGLDDEALVARVCGGRPRPRALRCSDDELYRRIRVDEERFGLAAICRHDPEYPARLHQLYDPPAVLYVRGGAARLAAALGAGDRPTVALVGARRASAESRSVTHRMAEALAAAGITVVSGMAFGVDEAAHEGALVGAAGAASTVPGGAGTTLAVLAGGVERPSPARLRPLYERIARNGAVVSELPPGTTPRRWTFPARNRLIAALADAVVVVAAARGSGSLITADFAVQLDRPLGAVPGSPVAAGHQGSNALLRDPAAAAVLTAEDAGALLGDAVRARWPITAADQDPLRGLDGTARAIGEQLLDGPCTLEHLVTDRAPGAVLAALGELEAAGRLRRTLDGDLELLPAGGRAR